MFNLTITAEQLQFMESFLQYHKTVDSYNKSEEENALIDGWLISLETATQGQ